jgi:hypothetical protein
VEKGSREDLRDGPFGIAGRDKAIEPDPVWQNN